MNILWRNIYLYWANETIQKVQTESELSHTINSNDQNDQKRPKMTS